MITRLRIGLRIALILGWSALIIPLHLLFKAIGKPLVLPPTFLAGVGWIAGLRVKTVGKPEKTALILANHVSWLDILALAGAARSAFVAHDGLAGQKLLKWLCEQNQTIFIARHRRTTINDQTSAIHAALGERPLTIFPEGTTSDGTSVPPFKSALLAAVQPIDDSTKVQPVALVYEDVPEVAWVGEDPGANNVLMILGRRKPVRLTIYFLPPLEGAALTDRKSITLAAHKAIAETLARVLQA
ncbi:1-acyl-sn-glycerol-3-phosphate acyltransferase [Altererythrobacter indicus]|uniref:1-acyl-sn-glycerol-3-phosphate acyltransferase n=1 Tax=Altericroceibacterium indicum TaxID=374177 RepID=A0A845A932_9SPHN|nr:lysophospholipid acyltransferase family protein [Altericroceibacterium indicum]MXP26760.1 1-acyl-sn-glycerol-3-phosphate acyltransferase [Altericroceibacterium indicum]